jgi:diacylglycerol O-acyltransferase
MRQLTSLDAQFLALESSHQTGHVAGLAILDPSTKPSGDLTFQDICALVEERLPLLPPLRWRLMEVPLGLGIVADRDQMPDLWTMLDRLRDSLHELK